MASVASASGVEKRAPRNRKNKKEQSPEPVKESVKEPPVELSEPSPATPEEDTPVKESKVCYFLKLVICEFLCFSLQLGH